jgi:hypothetical protein
MFAFLLKFIHYFTGFNFIFMDFIINKEAIAFKTKPF